MLDDFFDRELSDDAAQVAFHDEADQAFALVGSLGEKLLGRGQDGFHVRFHFDLRDRFNGNGDALLGVEVLLRGYVERHEFEREFPTDLHHREDDGAMAFDDARSAEAVDDQSLMRAGFAIQARQHAHREHDGEQRQANDDPDFHDS